MSLFNSLWNSTAAYFPTAVKYCADNNISFATTTDLAKDIGFIAVKSVEFGAEKTAQAVSHTPAIAYQWAGSAGQAALDLGYTALKGTHDWYFGKPAVQETGFTMAAKLAAAAGSSALNLGYAGIKGAYDWYFGGSAQAAATSAAAHKPLPDMEAGGVLPTSELVFVIEDDMSDAEFSDCNLLGDDGDMLDLYQECMPWESIDGSGWSLDNSLAISTTLAVH